MQANGPELTSKSILKQTSDATVYVISSIAAVVFIITIVLVVLALYLRNTRKKEESYSAHYHRDNILTLDGLSGSHASDAIQTRQNSKSRSFSREGGYIIECNDDAVVANFELGLSGCGVSSRMVFHNVITFLLEANWAQCYVNKCRTVI